MSDEVTVLSGVKAERSQLLAKLGIQTIAGLLFHAPKRHEDRRHFCAIADAKLHETLVFRGAVVELGLKTFRNKQKCIFEMVIDDGSGRLHCRWWNQRWMMKNYKKGDSLLICGKVKDLRPVLMEQPQVEVIDNLDENCVHLKRLVPVYPLTDGISQRWLRGLVWDLLFVEQLEIPEKPWSAFLPDTYPRLKRAFEMLHYPDEPFQFALGRNRLALDELMDLQVAIQSRRRALESKAKAIPVVGDNRLIKPFLKNLEFGLTGAQSRVLKEIRADLNGKAPMRRLLQGDVGAGKTVVAACTALMLMESGWNVAMMAPTEILAEQHFTNLVKWLGPFGIDVVLRTGSNKGEPLDASLFGRVDRPTFWVGTHALIQESVELKRLGLVIIDEQHRFGVAQREKLLRKGSYPHLLVMTATPIPRTLALTLYGDLDTSILDQLPPGRIPIKTYLRSPEKLPKVWEFVMGRLKAGEQAYVVYPRVEQNSDGEVKTVLEQKEVIARAVSPYRVEALHGRLKPAEKDVVMGQFRKNEIHILVATSLIEVGVDVPNATIMIIENAEQFGLAQLHQLRGRIGRGGKESYCILVSATEDEEALRRLRIMEQTNDGFEIAEADLSFRGPGELLGSSQSGMPDFRFADLIRDLDLVKESKRLAASYLDSKEEFKLK
ncbi:MAG: ATP-dependent DNA helicase RecG [Verrucomicrobiales bacterium]